MASPAHDSDDDMPDFGDMSALLAEAENAFIEWSRKALADVKPKAEMLDGPAFAEARDAIFAVFHDLKGAGGGVGIALMTDIGESGCNYLRHMSEPSEKASKVMAAHIAAAEGVLAAGIRGDGGPAGRALLSKLKAATA